MSDVQSQLDAAIRNLSEQKTKEAEEDASLGLDDLWGSSNRSGSSNPGASLTEAPPVGIFNFNFGENVEKDEDGVDFQTWNEERSFRRDCLGFIEQFYHANGTLPEFALLHSTFESYPERPRYLKGWRDLLDDWIEPLEARGLPTFRTAENYLDPGFVAAVHLIANKVDTRTIAAKLKQCGIKTAQWNAFLKKKKYLDYYKFHIERVFEDETQIEAKSSLDTLVRQGDLQAIKYYNEVTGIYRNADNSTTQATVGAILAGVLEILARKVSTEILNEIAYEIRAAKPIQELMGAIETQAS